MEHQVSPAKKEVDLFSLIIVDITSIFYEIWSKLNNISSIIYEMCSKKINNSSTFRWYSKTPLHRKQSTYLD